MSKMMKIDFLRGIKKLKGNERLAMIRYLDHEGVNILCSCFHNVLFENHNLNKRKRKNLLKKLKGKEKQMITLSKKTNNIKRRKKVLMQEGGGIISLIVSTALPILIQYIYSKIKK